MDLIRKSLSGYGFHRKIDKIMEVLKLRFCIKLPSPMPNCEMYF